MAWLARVSAFVSLVLIAAPAFAETDAEKEARIQAAVDLCDQEAAVPLDPEATAPPIQFSELFVPFDQEVFEKRAATCREAMVGAPDKKRLRLQYLRTAIPARIDIPQMVPDLRALAATGSAEARFLLYILYGERQASAENDITRAEAIHALTAAAEAGHQNALEQALREYRFGPNVLRDPARAAHFAEGLMNLPRQGPHFAGKGEEAARERGRWTLGWVLVMDGGFDDERRAAGFAIVKEIYDSGDQSMLVPYLTALRYGRGTVQDAAQARALAEQAVAEGRVAAVSVLAGMLAEGEGGPADGKRALALLTSEIGQKDFGAKEVLAGLYLDNRYTGRRPREAARLLAAGYIESLVRAAALFTDYDVMIDGATRYETRLAMAAEVGEPGAAMALVRLKFSNHPDFGNDDSGARAILARLAAAGDREAALMLVETQFGDLGTSSFNPRPRGDAMPDEEARAVVEAGIADGMASAYRVKGRLQRVGVVFPQDDAAATKALLDAAERGDVAAMILVGDAYGDGLGIAENHRERLRWWREAAARGALAAREKLANAFVFDSFDKLMTLREGVTERVALYNNSGAGFVTSSGPVQLMGMFSGGRAMDAGTSPMASAVMDAFRVAPAGLAEEKLVPLIRVIPDAIRIEIERQLKAAEFFSGTPDGNFGPDVRQALADWVDAMGPLPDVDPSDAGGTTAPVAAGPLPMELVDRVRDRVFTAAMKKKMTDAERTAVIAQINALAAYGDLPARWVLVRNYHQSGAIRQGVSPAEVTRYGLDILVTRPEGVEKPDFEFIFDVTAMMDEGTIDQFGAALVNAVRDDERLRDPLTLGAIMQQMIFAPGACDSVLKAIETLKIADGGDDGCGEGARSAIIAFAKSSGAANVDSAARQAAAQTLAELDAGAN
ncbi:MAG: hypothetical protein KDJ86_00270 [Bauldia sp.]|uniref:hypothetical protein n=1 Tax=Bauldia sp. TaxID=2575872 RepID=UPI001E126B06|nr:hypothetical protein [Bauldia sp.]MCB1494190.1 hypothetical protein [Bauldia sp.]